MHRFLALGGLCLALTHFAAAAPDDVANSARDWQAIVEADSLSFRRALASSQFDTLQISLAEHIAWARQDARLDYLPRALTALGIAQIRSGNAVAAEQSLAEAVQLALAEADTAQALLAMQHRTYGAGARGQLDEQGRHAEFMLELAERSRNRQFLAIAENFLGWNSLQRGEQRRALAHLERAVATQRELQNASEEAIALVSYGGTLFELGEFERAQVAYARLIELAEGLSNDWLLAQALVGLADVEWKVGDPAAATQHYAQARQVQQARSSPIDEALLLLRLATMEHEQGRWQAAERFGREALDLCERHGFARVRGSCLNAIAESAAAQGHHAVAASCWEAVLAMEDAADVDSRVAASLGLAQLRERQGDAVGARAIVERAHAAYASNCSVSSLHLLLARRAELARLDGDLEASERAARILLDRAVVARLLDDERLAWQLLARCDWDRAAWADAERNFERACAAWEQLRRRSGDPGWREWWGASGIDLGSEYAAFLLDPRHAEGQQERLRRAYEVASRFKTRTLRERIAGPGLFAADSNSETAVAPTLAELQASLRPQERLFEWFCGAGRTLLFVVSANECVAEEVATPDELARWVAAARDLASDSTPSPAWNPIFAQKLRERCFAAQAAMLDTTSAWILAPDGPLHRLPFAALWSATSQPRAHWLMPSGPILVEARRRGAGDDRNIWLQLGEDRRVGAGLPAAARELRWIERHLKFVSRSDAVFRDEWKSRWAEHAVLHFAGHAQFDDQYPWRSSIQLRSASAESARDSLASLVFAADVASLRLPAKLVVLASCSSADGRIQGGEGVAGLSGAFVAAGVPTVVASLWPVGDAATQLLMQDFYSALTQQRSVAEALAHAQAQLRARFPEAMREWAGFVVIGDGSIRPALARRTVPRPEALPLAAAALALGAAIAGLWGWRRQSEGRV